MCPHDERTGIVSVLGFVPIAGNVLRQGFSRARELEIFLVHSQYLSTFPLPLNVHYALSYSGILDTAVYIALDAVTLQYTVFRSDWTLTIMSCCHIEYVFRDVAYVNRTLVVQWICRKLKRRFNYGSVLI